MTTTPKVQKKRKTPLPGQQAHKGLKDAIEHVKKVMGELHNLAVGKKK